MIEIELPDGTILEAPDNADVSAVAKNYLARQQKPAVAAQGPSALESLGVGLRDPISGAAQLLERSLPQSVTTAVNRFGNKLADLGLPIARLPETNGMDALIQEREKAYQGKREAAGETGFDGWRAGGNLVTTALATRGLGAPTTLGGKVAQGVGIGAATGATAPVTDNQDNFWQQKGLQTAVGGAAGGVVPVAGAGIARIIKPKTSVEAARLLDEGVTPTPGQILGGRWQVAEDKLTSLPIVGDAISSARRKSLDEFNRAALKRALEPIGGKVPKDVGHEGIAAVREQISKAYDDLLPKMSFKADNEFVRGLNNLRSLASELPEQQAKQFDKILKTQVQGKMTPQGLMNGARLKEVESELGRLAKGYESDPSFDNRQLGNAINELQNLIRQNLSRSNPQYADELAKVNKAWANYTRLRGAAGMQGAVDGKFSPAQLSNAVRSQDKTVGKRAFSEGTALMQDLSDAGKSVLASKYPDSGTAGRAWLGAGTIGLGSVFSPTALVGLGAASLPYLPGGRQAMAGLLARRPQAAGLLADRVRAMSPMLAGSGGLLAAEQY